jgi:hypothetical protein
MKCTMNQETINALKNLSRQLVTLAIKTLPTIGSGNAAGLIEACELLDKALAKEIVLPPLGVREQLVLQTRVVCPNCGEKFMAENYQG